MNYLEHGAKDWIETDIAMYFAGCCLGIFPPPDENFDGYRIVKSILWSSNETSETLEIIIKRLVRNNVLIFDEEKELFKWNQNYSIDDASVQNT